MRRSRLTENKWRRLGVHATGPHALAGHIIGGNVGAGAGFAASRGDIHAAQAGQFGGKYAGQAAGAGISHAYTGKALDRLEKVAGSNSASKADKVAAGREFRKSHKITSKFVLPKNEYERHKLANRSKAGHIAHGALRLAVGSPWNVGRYATKVSYAKAGIHRDEEFDMTRDELIEALVYELMEGGDEEMSPEEMKAAQRRAKLKKWGKRAAIGAGVAGAAAGVYGLSRTKAGTRFRHAAGKKAKIVKWHADDAASKAGSAARSAASSVSKKASDYSKAATRAKHALNKKKEIVKWHINRARGR